MLRNLEIVILRWQNSLSEELKEPSLTFPDLCKFDVSSFWSLVFDLIGHVNEYPTMHYFGIPGNTQSMIPYKILTWVFPEIPVKICIVGMLLTSPIEVYCRSVRWQLWITIITDSFQFICCADKVWLDKVEIKELFILKLYIWFHFLFHNIIMLAVRGSIYFLTYTWPVGRSSQSSGKLVSAQGTGVSNIHTIWSNLTACYLNTV